MIALLTPSGNATVAPVVLDPKPRSIEELTETVSASRLTAWQRCRQQFYYRYVAGIRKPPTPALHVGSTVHRVLQQWNLARWKKQRLDPEALKQVFDEAWNEQNGIEWEDETEAKDSAWNLLETYFQQTPITAEEKPEGVEVSVEADLSKHGLTTLVGILDLVREGGTIVDFKTSARTPDPQMVKHLHAIQTTAYAVLYREATGKSESGIELHHLVKTKTPKLVVTELGIVTENQITRLLRVIESYLDGLARKDFVPSPGLQCSSCEFFRECQQT